MVGYDLQKRGQMRTKGMKKSDDASADADARHCDERTKQTLYFMLTELPERNGTYTKRRVNATKLHGDR